MVAGEENLNEGHFFPQSSKSFLVTDLGESRLKGQCLSEISNQNDPLGAPSDITINGESDIFLRGRYFTFMKALRRWIGAGNTVITNNSFHQPP